MSGYAAPESEWDSDFLHRSTWKSLNVKRKSGLAQSEVHVTPSVLDKDPLSVNAMPWSREARPALSRPARPVPLLTLERDPPPRAPRRSRSGPKATGRRSKSATAREQSQPPGLQQWMTSMLRDKSTLQLDTTNICLVLHALWRKPARREPMLKDVGFRTKAFNAFLMDVLKAYQAWDEYGSGDVPISSMNKKKRKHDDVADQSGAGDASLDLSDFIWEPTAAGDSADERCASDNDDLDWREASPAATPRTSSQPSTPASRPRPEPARASQAEASRTQDGTLMIRRPRWPNVQEKLAPEPASAGDLCGRLAQLLMRTSGRKVRKETAVLSLAQKDEDDSGVPHSAFLFIRCVRCPELVFVDYAAIRDHWAQKQHFLSCVLCDSIVSTDRLALAHLRVSHKEPVPEGWFRLVRCHPCQRSGFYSTEQVISHMAGHRSERARNPAIFPPFLTCYKRIRCNQCGLKMVNHRSELEDHYKRDPPPLCRHDASRPPPLPCPACRRVWAGPAALAAHIKLSRGLCKAAVQPLSVTPMKQRGVDRAFCPVCSREMNPGELLADHLMTHLAPGLRCTQCGFVAASHQEMQTHWTFTWRCDCSACDTHVGRGARLLQHIIEDHDSGRCLTGTARARPKRALDDQGICPFCGKHHTRLKDHIKASHSTRHCPCCDKEVKLITYRNHQAKLRNVERLRCKVCDKQLSTSWSLQGHMRTHTGEKPYECQLCDAGFAQNVSLKTHMKSAHGVVLPAAAAAPPAAVTEVATADVLFE